MMQKMVIKKRHLFYHELILIYFKFEELIYFTIISLVFLFSFGVSTQALLYPNQDFSFNVLGNAFMPSILLNIVGDGYIKLTIYSQYSGLLSGKNKS